MNPNRKKADYDKTRDEIRNLVPLCKTCTGKCGTQCLLDWMSDQGQTSRGRIFPMLCRRLYASYSILSIEYESTLRPKEEELQKALREKSLASFVSAAYQPSKMNDYAKSFNLSEADIQRFNRMNSKNFVLPSEWTER